jgi:hypothetical protein
VAIYAEYEEVIRRNAQIQVLARQWSGRKELKEGWALECA